MGLRDVDLYIRLLETRDLEPIAAACAALGWNKPISLYQRYLLEQEQNQRTVFIALLEGLFAGYLTIVWQPDYPPFGTKKIPEIQDFNVLPQFRRRGIGTCLMDTAEQLVANHSPTVGIGVGMTADYGAAQRMYILRGYIPDGHGLVSNNKFLKYGEMVEVDHDLNLHLIKILAIPSSS
jgi:GNAT superfamily N-acetyltransferase